MVYVTEPVSEECVDVAEKPDSVPLEIATDTSVDFTQPYVDPEASAVVQGFVPVLFVQ